MFNRQLHQRTAWLLLVLIGLVGSLGMGLHELVGGCHHCQCADCADVGGAQPLSSSDEAESACDCGFCDASESEAVDGQEKSHDRLLFSASSDCAVCQLLSLFVTTMETTSWEHSVYEVRGTIVAAIPLSLIHI